MKVTGATVGLLPTAFVTDGVLSLDRPIYWA